MPRLARRPLAWIVAAETVVCVALIATAWHLVATTAAAAAPAAGLPVIAAAPAPGDSPPAVAAQASSAAAAIPARPATATGGTFLGGLLEGLNRDQAAFENGEWSALQAFSGAITLYIERVMVPALERAEATGGR